MLLLSPDDPSKSWCGLAAQPEQLPSQLLARRPTDPPGGTSDAAAQSLRDQAITQLQKDGGLRPLSASLLASEALLRTPYRPFRLGERPGGAPQRAARFGGIR